MGAAHGRRQKTIVHPTDGLSALKQPHCFREATGFAGFFSGAVFFYGEWEAFEFLDKLSGWNAK